MRRLGPAADKELRRARDLLKGFTRRFELRLPPDLHGDPIGLLDLVSHGLYTESPADFDTSREIIETAGLYRVLASRGLVTSTDAALAALIGLLPRPG